MALDRRIEGSHPPDGQAPAGSLPLSLDFDAAIPYHDHISLCLLMLASLGESIDRGKDWVYIPHTPIEERSDGIYLFKRGLIKQSVCIDRRKKGLGKFGISDGF